MDAQTRQTLIQVLTRSSLWAIHPDAIITLLRAHGEWHAAKPSMIGKGASKVAVIPIQGVLTSDGPSWLGSNYRTISDAAEQAAADSSVKRAVLAVDSPGGEVNGLPETASIIANLAKTKTVSAIVEGDSASAAFWLTSQAHDITLTPSGEVGSVGVRMMHMDISKMLQDFGVTVTEIHAGDYKTEWSPYKPLSDAAKEDMQSRLNAVHDEFLSAVAAGRGNRASAEIKAGRFGEGRMFSASNALSHGLVDKVQSAREFYRAITPVEEETTHPTLPRRARLELERRKV
jgi:signal peptide peptidase SppA